MAQPVDSIIKKSSLQQTILFLSGNELKGRLTGSAGATEAAKFIAEKFSNAGLSTLSGKSYFDSFPAVNKGKEITGVNVIGSLPAIAANDTMVIFSAHYDHVGEGNEIEYNKDYRPDDATFNGANDNATGVAAVLELATYYSAQKNNRYNLLFIAFAGEEMGLIGSTHFSKRINPSKIKAVINLEMLGRGTNNNCFIITLGNNRIKKILNNYLKKSGAKQSNIFFTKDPYFQEELAYRSDHYPFARKIKNTFTIMATSPTDVFYHSVDDEYDTIDFDFLLRATCNIALACEYFTR